ncbi:hypothetical protein [Lapillicoccus sp.]|uniref:hypothetical protein n=1 Tax=Lapillicoccus sp. TaxID=1909287 RepID=UPI0032638D94
MTRRSSFSRATGVVLAVGGGFAVCGCSSPEAASAGPDVTSPTTTLTVTAAPSASPRVVSTSPTATKTISVTADNICTFVNINTAQTTSGVSPLTASVERYEGRIVCNLAGPGAKPTDAGVVMFIYDPTQQPDSYDPHDSVGGLRGGKLVSPDPRFAPYPQTGRYNTLVTWVHDTHPAVLSARGPLVDGANGSHLVPLAQEIETALTSHAQ